MIRILFWYSPILSGLLTSLHILEGLVFYSDSPLLFFYRFCRKTSFPSDKINEKAQVFKVHVTLFMVPSLLGELCCHIAALYKQTRIENKATVYLVKNNQLVTRHRHHRNVISLAGHCLSFALNLLETFLHINALYFLFDFETVTMIRNLNFFFIPSIIFTVHPLIETLFSETLRENLFPKVLYSPF